MSLTLPDEYRGVGARVPVQSIDCQENRARAADLSEESISALADSIERQGLQQRIGVRNHGDAGYLLIWGRRRLEAHRAHPDRLGQEIDAVIYPEDLPEAWAAILEIDENVRRQDLSTEERAVHEIGLAAALKELAEDEIETLKGWRESEVGKELVDPSDLTAAVHNEPAPKRKRGRPKKVVAQIAEHVGVDQSSVRARAKRASEVLGEPVDLEKDTPQELRRKADKLQQAPKVRKPRGRAAAKQAAESGIPPKPKRIDIAMTIRNLDFALSDGFDAVAWTESVPAFQRRDLAHATERVAGWLLDLSSTLGNMSEEP